MDSEFVHPTSLAIQCETSPPMTGSVLGPDVHSRTIPNYSWVREYVMVGLLGTAISVGGFIEDRRDRPTQYSTAPTLKPFDHMAALEIEALSFSDYEKNSTQESTIFFVRDSLKSIVSLAGIPVNKEDDDLIEEIFAKHVANRSRTLL